MRHSRRKVGTDTGIVKGQPAFICRASMQWLLPVMVWIAVLPLLLVAGVPTVSAQPGDAAVPGENAVAAEEANVATAEQEMQPQQEVGPASDGSADDGDASTPEDKTAARQQGGALALIRACNGELQKTVEWLETIEQRLMQRRQQVQQRRQRDESAWRQLSEQLVGGLLRRPLSQVRLKRCERLQRPRLQKTEEGFVLQVRGLLLQPQELERRLRSITQMTSLVRLDFSGVQQIPGGVCRVDIGGCSIPDTGLQVSRYGAQVRRMAQQRDLPSAQQCENMGKALQQRVAEGTIRIPQGVEDFWVHVEGKLALCTFDGEEWYVRQQELAWLAGIILPCGD